MLLTPVALKWALSPGMGEPMSQGPKSIFLPLLNYPPSSSICGLQRSQYSALPPPTHPSIQPYIPPPIYSFIYPLFIEHLIEHRGYNTEQDSHGPCPSGPSLSFFSNTFPRCLKLTSLENIFTGLSLGLCVLSHEVVSDFLRPHGL